MAFGTLFRYGIPISFVYCTIYQQNIWREGDEMLVEEQKRTWRKFFNLLQTGLEKLTPSSQFIEKQQTLGSSLDALDIKSFYNSKVTSAFTVIDQVVTKPKLLGCKIYRKIQPYLSQPTGEKVSKKED